jgi:hypothetical protein
MHNPMRLPNITSELKEIITRWPHLPKAVCDEIIALAAQAGQNK